MGGSQGAEEAAQRPAPLAATAAAAVRAPRPQRWQPAAGNAGCSSSKPLSDGEAAGEAAAPKERLALRQCTGRHSILGRCRLSFRAFEEPSWLPEHSLATSTPSSGHQQLGFALLQPAAAALAHSFTSSPLPFLGPPWKVLGEAGCRPHLGRWPGVAGSSAPPPRSRRCSPLTLPAATEVHLTHLLSPAPQR